MAKKLNIDINKYIKIITENKNFSNIAIIIFAVLIFLDILLIFIPQIRSIKRFGLEISQAKQKLVLGENELAGIDSLKSQLEKKFKEISLKESRFASEEDLALLIEEISKAASDSKVKIKQLKPVRKEGFSKIEAGQEELFIEVPILIRATAGYHSLGKFINNLEKTRNVFKIAELSIVANSADYLKPEISLSIITILKARQ